MKIGAMMALLAVIGTPTTQASGESERQLAVVTVYVQRNFNDIRGSLPHAEGIASKMLSKARVQVQWRTGSPNADREAHPILIEITSDTPERLRPGALAYARVFEGIHIRIFWDRIEQTGDKSLTDALLAHVLAHEITHVLEKVNRHSPEGVMKAHWTAHDLWSMKHKPLAFDPDDIKLIHFGLAHDCLVGETARSEACSSQQRQSTKEAR